jgi:hypothetical protein
MSNYFARMAGPGAAFVARTRANRDNALKAAKVGYRTHSLDAAAVRARVADAWQHHRTLMWALRKRLAP